MGYCSKPQLWVPLNRVPGARVAGVVFEAHLEPELAQRYPAGFATPACVDQVLAIGQQPSEGATGLWRQRFFERFYKLQGSNADLNLVQWEISSLLATICTLFYHIK